MIDRLQAAMEELKRRIREAAEALEEALSPSPELVPVPVDSDSRRRRRR